MGTSPVQLMLPHEVCNMPAPDDNPSERRRRQNRESQRRYRDKHRKEQTKHMLDLPQASSVNTSTDPAASASRPPPAMLQCDFTHHRMQGAAAVEDGALNLSPEANSATSGAEFRSAHQCSCSMSRPPTNHFPERATPISLPAMDSESNSASMETLLYSDRDPECSRPYAFQLGPGDFSGWDNFLQSPREPAGGNTPESVHRAKSPVSAGRDETATAAASPVSRNGTTTSARAQQGRYACITPRSTPQHVGDAGETRPPAKRLRDSDSFYEPLSKRAKSDDFQTSADNSKAENLILELEKLYDFGVSIGILPEDRDLATSLGRMKARFRSLSSRGDWD